jgi:hypothetical protein
LPHLYSVPFQVKDLLKNLDYSDPVELHAGYLKWLDNAPEPDDEVDFRPLLHSDVDWVNLGLSDEVKNIEAELEREMMPSSLRKN